MQRRVFLLSLLGVAALPALSSPTRPLVLIFPVVGGRLSTVTAEKPGPDGLSDGDRITMAARAVRAQLDSEKVVDTLLFNPSDIFFQRSAASAKVKLPPGGEPDEVGRLKIAKEVGAHYIATVFSRLAGEAPALPKNSEAPLNDRQRRIAEATGQKPIERVNLPTENLPLAAPSLEVELLELKPGGKLGLRWQERVAMVASNDSPTVRRNQGIPPGMESAARTLVLRILGGPLREFSRTAVEPGLLPPSAAAQKNEPELPPLDFDAEVGVLVAKAKELMERDRAGSAVPLLRQAINYAPRKALPRVLLTEAYLQIRRSTEAINEAKRALVVASDATPEQKAELTRLTARAMIDRGDQEEATRLYTQILKDNPKNTEARVGLAEMLLAKQENEAAEIQYRLIRQYEPGNPEAGRGLVRLLVAKGALEDAVREAKTSPEAIRHLMATVIFLEAASALAVRVVQNRTAWEEGKLSREIFYKATVSQSERAKLLAELLSSTAPPESEREVVRMAHNRRVLAANLLSQALGSLQAFLETGEVASGSRARTLITEFYTEMKDAQNPAKD